MKDCLLSLFLTEVLSLTASLTRRLLPVWEFLNVFLQLGTLKLMARLRESNRSLRMSRDTLLLPA